MPTAVDKLTKDSSDEQVQEAVSSCISQMADEHPDWDQDRLVAACSSMAREKSGRPILKK